MTATDAPPHTCKGSPCGVCGEPEELWRLRQTHVRPAIELNAGQPDWKVARLVMDELRPLLLAALTIQQQAEKWAASDQPAVAGAAAQILSQFGGTVWERPVPPGQSPQSDVEDDEEEGEDDDLDGTFQVVRQAPEGVTRVCDVVRIVDATGVSGVGVIGQGFLASDGAMSWRWFGGPPQDEPKWESYDNPGPGPFEKISGHSGNTKLVWRDVVPHNADRSP